MSFGEMFRISQRIPTVCESSDILKLICSEPDYKLQNIILMFWKTIKLKLTYINIHWQPMWAQYVKVKFRLIH